MFDFLKQFFENREEDEEIEEEEFYEISDTELEELNWPRDILLYQEIPFEIPDELYTLANKNIYKIILELRKGIGFGRIFNYPVDPEPPFEIFNPIEF